MKNQNPNLLLGGIDTLVASESDINPSNQAFLMKKERNTLEFWACYVY